MPQLTEEEKKERAERAERSKILSEIMAIIKGKESGDAKIALLSELARKTPAMQALISTKIDIVRSQATQTEKGKADRTKRTPADRARLYMSRVETGISVKGADGSVYPDLEATAKGRLQAINGTSADIIVIPDGVNLQGGRAITLKGEQDRVLVMSNLVTVAAKEENKKVDLEKLAERVAQDSVIAIKISLAEAGGLDLDGNLWHEYGHVILDAAESARVFAHEFKWIRDKYDAETARSWITNTSGRSLQYFASTATPLGIEELNQVLESILTEEQYTEWKSLRGIADANRSREEADTEEGSSSSTTSATPDPSLTTTSTGAEKQSSEM